MALGVAALSTPDGTLLGTQFLSEADQSQLSALSFLASPKSSSPWSALLLQLVNQ